MGLMHVKHPSGLAWPGTLPMIRVRRVVVIRKSLVMDRISVVNMLLTESLGAPERHHHHARHVNRREQRRYCANNPERSAPGRIWQTKRARAPNFPENLIFGKEPSEDWYAGDRQPSSQHRRESYGHVFFQPTHAPHVLLVIHPMNY